MKTLKILSRVSDMHYHEYVQRYLTVDVTDEEAELLTKFWESVQKRHKGRFPFTAHGFGEGVNNLNLATPVSKKLRGTSYNRFEISTLVHLEEGDKVLDGFNY